jgi:hypothetical protein
VFYSRHYQGDVAGYRVRQTYLMHFFGFLATLIIAGAVLRFQVNSSLIWFSMVGIALAFGLGWIMAYAQMSSRFAVIEIQGSRLWVYSVYDWYFAREKVEVFPGSYAQPRRHPIGLELTFHDRVCVLKAQDWPEFSGLRLALAQMEHHSDAQLATHPTSLV